MRPRSRGSHRLRLIRLAPCATEQELVPAATGRQLPEKLLTLFGQVHMALHASLRLSDMQSSGIRVEVLGPEACRFLIAAAREQESVHELSEVGLAGVQEPPTFGDLEIAKTTS